MLVVVFILATRSTAFVSTNAYSEMFCFRKTWNNVRCTLWNISLRSMWNEICLRSRSEHFTFAKQIFHRVAISLAWKGKFRWGTCDKAGTPRCAFFICSPTEPCTRRNGTLSFRAALYARLYCSQRPISHRDKSTAMGMGRSANHRANHFELL